MFAEVTAEIIADHLLHNLSLLRRSCRPGTRICAPLKADAYGHGLTIVAPLLQRAGVELAAVAQLDEAIALRATGWQRPILVLGDVIGPAGSGERRERLEAAFEHDLMLTVVDRSYLGDLNAAAARAGRRLAVHVKVDTGMGRMGLLPDDAVSLILGLRTAESVHLAGIYSHFGAADLADRSLVDGQIATFAEVLGRVGGAAGPAVMRHLANTAATLERPETHYDGVRPGLGLYGYAPAERFRPAYDLRPCLRVRSRISALKELPPGHCVGYGCTFRTQQRTRVAIVPAGYHDGMLRAFSNRLIVGTDAGDARIIGRISMDQLALDVSDLPAARVGSGVTLIDPDPTRPNSVENMATLVETIPYEITCLLGPRLARRLV